MQSGMAPGVQKCRYFFLRSPPISYAEKSEAQGAKKGPFCKLKLIMGILATLSLSTETPRAGKNTFVDTVVSECP